MNIRVKCVGHHLQSVQEARPGPAEIGIAICDVNPKVLDGGKTLAELLVQHAAEVFERTLNGEPATGCKQYIGLAGSNRLPLQRI